LQFLHCGQTNRGGDLRVASVGNVIAVKARAASAALGLAVAALPIASHAAAPASGTASGPAGVTEYAKPVSSRLNPTGRVINMPVPLKDDGQALGDIVVVINPDDSVLIPKAALVNQLTRTLDAASLARLHGVPESNGQVSLGDLKAAGFNVKFDPGALELVFLPNADQRPLGDLSLARSRGPITSAAAARPAIYAGYVNVITGVDHRWGDQSGNETTSGRLDLESVFRMWNIAVENDFLYEGAVDTFSCPTGAVCNVEHQAGLKRRRSRAVYDITDYQIRLQFGDADVYGTGFQRTPDLLGFSIEKSPRKLRPGESIRPTGRSSFRLERNADVEVMINGAIVQRFRLRAGNYNLSDLPLSTGANEVQLIISDDAGERRTLAFTTYFDGSLLGAGKSEWSLSGGVPSYFKDSERQYKTDQHFGTGFYRYGLTDQLTAESHAQADDNVRLGGLGIFAMLPWGLVGGQGAVSNSPSGTGYAVNANYDLVNFRGPFSQLTDLRESFRFGTEYRSSQFRTPGEFLTTASGILYPQYNYWLRLTGSYTVPFNNGISTTFGARYQFADDKAFVSSPYTLKGDRYGVDLTLSSPLTPTLSGSMTVGYSNESYLLADTSGKDVADLRAMMRLYWRPDESTRVAASYDTLTREAYVSGYYGTGRGVDRWDTSVDVQTQGRNDRANGTAAVGYYGNRAEARVAHTGGFDGVGFGSLQPKSVDQRTSARVGSSIAFADGSFGIGQPIRGGGFAIVAPHESIADKTVTVGTADEPRARADFLGPAVVTDLPSYSNATIPVDVAGLPLGYSLGAGAFETYAPYRGGYKFEVGSAYSVSAYGTLLKADGEPISLLTGVASAADDPAKQVAIFTNGSGKFGADGLAPGKWVIDMATEGAPTRFEIEIPKGTNGLFKAGELKPSGRR
jgi:outer membrane usher protein